MEKNKKEILQRLEKLGLIVQESTTNNLIIAINDILNELRENEIKLLEEFEKLHKRKIKGKELSFLEESFYKHVLENYSKKLN